MGHRKHSQPRRGSLAYLPRGRAKSMEARIRMRGWPKVEGGPRLTGHCGFKAGCVQLVTIDDREHAPNHGKQLVSLGTVIATPPVTVLGVRGYSKDVNGLHAAFDAFAGDLPRHISKRLSPKGVKLEDAEKSLGRTHSVFAILAVSPSAAGLDQKKPYVFEMPVSGGTARECFDHAKDLLGREVRFGDVFEPGAGVDVAAITKGKGWQGVIRRYGAKRKQHKSRKTVRELGSLGPISPQYIMYTVPRAGQTGFHQRIEYGKRVMKVGVGRDDKITPPGGYKHFGDVEGDYVILKGSVPGANRRLVKMRMQVRNAGAKPSKPNILEVVA